MGSSTEVYDHKEHRCEDMDEYLFQNYSPGVPGLCCICIGHKCGEEPVWEAVDRDE